jgi:hypothetical protein
MKALIKLIYYTVILIFIVSLELLFTSQAYAKTANLILTKEFKLLAINGKSYPIKLVNRHQIIPIIQGHNKIALMYHLVWRGDQNRPTTIQSKPLIISFYLSKQDDIRLTYLKPATMSAILNYSKSPQFKFVNKNNQSINMNIAFPTSQSIDGLKQQTKFKSGLKRQQKPIIIMSKKRKIP